MATANQVDFLLAGYRHPKTDKELSGGKVKTYLDGTSTLSSLWTDSAKSGSADNPFVLDAAGKAEVYGDNVYKFEIYDSNDTLIETLNGLTYRPKSSTIASLSADYGCDLAAAVIAIGATVTTLIVDCDAIISSGTTVTIPDTLLLNIIKSGSVDGVSGGGTETLAFSGLDPSAGYYQIFGSNLVVTGLKVSNVKWTGGIGDSGTTDNQAAFKSAADSLLSGGKLIIPKDTGYYECDSAVIIDKPMSIEVDGVVQPNDILDDLFRVTSDDVYFTGTGIIQGPGTYNQAGASTYFALITFLGTSAGDRIERVKVDGTRGLRILEPFWAGVQFRYTTDGEVSGVYFEGGPDAKTGTNQFCILGLDCFNTNILNNTFTPNSGGGSSIQFFNLSVSGLSEAPCRVDGNKVEFLWEKLAYIFGANATVTNNAVKGTNISDAIRVVKGRNIVTGNRLQNTWGIDSFASAANSIFSNNVITDYSHNGITVNNTDSVDITNIIIEGNIISSLTTDDDVYEGIIVKTPVGGGDIRNVSIINNIIENPDIRTAGGNSGLLGGIRVVCLNAANSVYDCQIEENMIKGAGAYGMRLESLQHCSVQNNKIVNSGNDDAGTVNGLGINLRGDMDHTTISNNRFGDDRGGSSRYSAAIAFSSVTTPHNGNIIQNNTSWSDVAGTNKEVYQIGNPAATGAEIQVGGNKTKGVPLFGTFTMAASGGFDVANTNIRSTVYPNITLSAVNASAAVLQGGANHLYPFSKTVEVGFRVGTGGGGAAAGTEIFYYQIIQ